MIGFTVFVLGVLALLASGALALVSRQRIDRRLALAGGVVALLGLVQAGFGMYRRQHELDGFDLQPKLETVELVGTWRLDAEWLTLRADGAFTDSGGRTGSWARSRDENAFEVGDRSWVAFRRRGELVLLPMFRDDPDEWNFDRVWTRTTSRAP